MNRQFLNWIADRIVYMYGESQHVDFVTKLRAIADADSKAITALLDMVKAFGSGVLAADTVQAAALAKAYACIEGDLMGKAEQSHGTKAAVEPVPAVQIFGWPEAGCTMAMYVKKNEGKRVRVVFTDTERPAEIGTIDSDGIGGNYFWLLEDQKSDFTRYRNSINFADVESITEEKKPIVQDMEPAEADRSVGDVAKDWPVGRSTLADYVERNKGNRVRIEFDGNGVPDKVCTIERIGSITYFWVLDDQGKHGGRFSVAFCAVHTITRIPNRVAFPATMHPYTKEEPAVLPDSWEKDDAARKAEPDNWPGSGVSLNSYLNARVGQMLTVDYGESKDRVTGELFRNPSQPHRYRLLLRTGSEAIDISLVWGVSCAK